MGGLLRSVGEHWRQARVCAQGMVWRRYVASEGGVSHTIRIMRETRIEVHAAESEQRVVLVRQSENSNRGKIKSYTQQCTEN